MDTLEPAYTPALGKVEFTSDYDRVIAIMTREKKWRGRLLQALAPQSGEQIIDIGSGTGSLAIMIKQTQPEALVLGIDPDPEVQAIAIAKAEKAETDIVFVTAMGDAAITLTDNARADKVVISLVLHQCPFSMKQSILANAFALLKRGGHLFVADYGLQRSLLMQLLFNQVRSLDGYENTKANKDGAIPSLMEQAGFDDVGERWSVATPTGSISLWVGRKTGG